MNFEFTVQPIHNTVQNRKKLFEKHHFEKIAVTQTALIGISINSDAIETS